MFREKRRRCLPVEPVPVGVEYILEAGGRAAPAVRLLDRAADRIAVGGRDERIAHAGLKLQGPRRDQAEKLRHIAVREEPRQVLNRAR